MSLPFEKYYGSSKERKGDARTYGIPEGTFLFQYYQKRNGNKIMRMEIKTTNILYKRLIMSSIYHGSSKERKSVARTYGTPEGVFLFQYYQKRNGNKIMRTEIKTTKISFKRLIISLKRLQRSRLNDILSRLKDIINRLNEIISRLNGIFVVLISVLTSFF